MTSRAPLRWLQRGLLLLGLLLLALWSKAAYESRSFQSAESWKLETALGNVVSAPSKAALVAVPAFDASRVKEPDAALGRIEISRLRIAAIVAEGVDQKTLRRAIGHVPWTALPGRPGNCALAGHRDTFLRGLRGVRVNDLIRIVTLGGTYTYQVAWSKVVEPRDIEVLDSTATRSLTLVTCYPFEFIGHAPQRFVVRARQVEVPARSTAIKSRVALQPRGPTAEGR